ncbi:hypothetical protein QEH52_03885 [Coraliomargarita sp. SDUM461003]|uniref:DUF2059 domain-containing protein n=1 Tax=Thalassobacterium maritimum TaxID=3041265 RepID=A0ABU1AR54_9BACT|nr:hypothetical protein [Coraliomargarita sp. SDUM461003]MDQ8206635.1 hypothetical protein [Coraliomargarita sp. SDUM461003]
MTVSKLSLSVAAAMVASITSAWAALSAPLLTLDVKNYESLTADIGQVADVVGEDPAMVPAQLEAMLGAEVMALVDASQPWHLAVWMESLMQPPVYALALPIADFETFETAIQTSFLGMMGAQYIDAGERVVVFGSKPGIPVADSWAALLASYANALVLEPSETVQLSFSLNESMRTAAVAGLAMAKGQMMASMDAAELADSGIPPETMQAMMESYLSFYINMLRDLDRMDLGMSVDENDWKFALELTPLANTPSARFLASQNVDISDIANAVDWDADIAVAMGMGALPAEWQTSMEAFMQAMMPLYGLEDAAAAEWVEVTQRSLPFKGVYSMDFAEGMSFSGFYEILQGSAAEVYESWISLCEGLVVDESAMVAYYSDIVVKRGYRSEAGHPVDFMELTVNPDHPAMASPEQEEVMNQFFKDGKIAYEMCLIDDRIYMGTQGDLSSTIAGASSLPAIEINEKTRIAGSMNFISLMKMGASVAGEDAELDLSEVDTVGNQITFSAEVDNSLLMKTKLPLQLIKVFRELDEAGSL